ncbi:MAG: AAA family ATPase [Microvirga sp.]
MAIEKVRELGQALRERIGRVIIGQEEAVHLLMVALVSEGHVLFEGPPGTGKTLLARSFAACVKLDFKRVQFTPDLMPGDLIGTNLFNFQNNAFTLTKGPLFTEFLLADEINRTPPKTQAALLEAMQERTITIDGTSHPLSSGFMVVATQNPIEQEGTYPLPEAQLDRFLLQIDVGYPDRAAERRILIETTGIEEHRATPVMTAEALMSAQRLVRRLPVGDSVVEAILNLVRSGRPGEGRPEITDRLLWGPGPRASQALMLAVRARALIEGRLAPSLDDVRVLAEPVLKHRMALTFSARADGETIPGLVSRLAAQLDA